MSLSTIAIALIFLIVAGFVVSFGYIRQSTVGKKETPSVSPTSVHQTHSTMSQDMKSMQTSRVVDAVSVLDELRIASPSYRHYCELVGSSQSEGGVIAPYSKRKVAYYDVRCYRLENRAGQHYETLVAHERSIDPVWFSDGSSDDRVYIDVASFGENVLLVNSKDHVERPDSEFSRTFGRADHGGSVAPSSAVFGLTPPGFDFDLGDIDLDSSFSDLSSGFSDFLGGASMPHGHHDYGSDIGTLIGGIALGTVLSQMGQDKQPQYAQPQQQQSSISGYRLVEDVIPLNSPVYCIGELYRTGDRLSIAKSVSTDHPTSFFATKPEAEVISHLAGR